MARLAFLKPLVVLTLTTAALPAWAQFIDAPGSHDVLASDFIGLDVYAVEPGAAPDVAARTDWDTIGEVEDLVLSETGQVRAVLVDVGGFLGLGAHTVALDMSQLTVLADETGARFVTTSATRAQLEGAPLYPMTPMTAEPMTTEPAASEAVPGAAGVPTEPAAEYVAAPADQVTAERLQGADVYEATGENIGEIAEVFVQDGKIREVLIDIGGFLGIGSRRVIFPFEQLQVMERSGEDALRVEVDATREALEKLPAQEG
jgi:sporulation protein YlmC with PRC-barrel domain